QPERTLISSFWIGDGAIAVYSPDKIRLMGKPDGGEFAGQTRFLSRQVVNQFSAQVNIGYFQDCQAVFLMTDGISDPCFETDAGLNNLQKWQQLWQEIQPKLQYEKPDQALLEWSKFFSAGHHDDRTLAVLWQDSLQKKIDENDDQKNSELNAHDKPLRG
ncbi:MAG: protein phosphatase 2C domain-containing protein, partial [Acinetobacter tjernbergiae]